MEDKAEKVSALHITREGTEEIQGIVVKELPLTIILNGRELVTTLCSPADLDYLVVGILASEGLIEEKDEIKSLVVDDKAGLARVETKGGKNLARERLFKPLVASGGGKGASSYTIPDNKTRLESGVTISADEVFSLVGEFLHRSPVYQATGGVHSAALCDSKGILVFHDDIGRHNAIDKVFGQCLMTGVKTDDHVLVTSGRISSEIVLKVAQRKVPILISKAAPTSLGVKLADSLGMTLIGFARETGMNAYANGWRVLTDAGE
jgi:FdhD protein